MNLARGGNQHSPGGMATPNRRRSAIKRGVLTYFRAINPACRAPSTFSSTSSTNTQDAAGNFVAATHAA